MQWEDRLNHLTWHKLNVLDKVLHLHPPWLLSINNRLYSLLAKPSIQTLYTICLYLCASDVVFISFNFNRKHYYLVQWEKGKGFRIIPSFFDKYRTRTQTSYHFNSPPFESKLPRFYHGMKFFRWQIYDILWMSNKSISTQLE